MAGINRALQRFAKDAVGKELGEPLASLVCSSSLDLKKG